MLFIYLKVSLGLSLAYLKEMKVWKKSLSGDVDAVHIEKLSKSNLLKHISLLSRKEMSFMFVQACKFSYKRIPVLIRGTCGTMSF